MLVRRHSEAAVKEFRRLRTHILMDAGELGSRHMSVNWIEIPSGASETLRSHEDAEQVYVVMRGSATMSAAGDTQRLGEGDLALIPPATDHSLANDGEESVAVLSVQSPAVAVEELFERQLPVVASAYDDEDEY